MELRRFGTGGQERRIIFFCPVLNKLMPRLHVHFRPYEFHVLAVKIEHS